MDGLSLIDQLSAAIGGPAVVIVGAALLVLCSLLRRALRGRVSVKVEAVVSMVSMVLSSVGTALYAGGDWSTGLIIGAATAILSDGFWELFDVVWPAKKSV